MIKLRIPPWSLNQSVPRFSKLCSSDQYPESSNQRHQPVPISATSQFRSPTRWSVFILCVEHLYIWEVGMNSRAWAFRHQPHSIRVICEQSLHIHTRLWDASLRATVGEIVKREEWWRYSLVENLLKVLWVLTILELCKLPEQKIEIASFDTTCISRKKCDLNVSAFMYS